ncbi:MAG: lipopolysaccharide kinase InaA family protein, partial [Planctomycetota bacterium]
MKSIIRSRFVRMKKENELWLVDSSLQNALERDILLRINEFPDCDGVRIIKDSTTRKVLHLPAHKDRPGIYLKCHRLRNRREKFLDRIRSSRAEREFNNLLRLEYYALPAPRALALGEIRPRRKPVRRFLAVEEVPDSKLIPEILESAGRSRTLSFCSALGRWLAEVHKAGISHHDLQPGNILVIKENDNFRFVLIDHHSVSFDPDIPPHSRSRMLAFLAGYIETSCGTHGLDSFMDAYRKISGIGPEFGPMLTAQIGLVRARRMRSRTARCLQNSSKFEVESTSEGKIYRRRDFPRETLKKIASGTGKDNGSFRIISRSPDADSGVATLNCGDETGRLFIKKFHLAPLGRKLCEIFTGSGARRAYRAGHGLDVRGIRTPKILACAMDADSGTLVTEYIEGAEALDVVAHRLFVTPRVRNEKPDYRMQNSFIKTLAAAVRNLHETGVYHPDLKAKNILAKKCDSGWEFYFVDLADVRFSRPTRRRIIKNLVQINAGVPYCIENSIRLRFLSEYCRGTDK